jgi:hypothetical protein
MAQKQVILYIPVLLISEMLTIGALMMTVLPRYRVIRIHMYSEAPSALHYQHPQHVNKPG